VGASLAIAVCALAPAAADAANRTGRYQVVFDHAKTARSASLLSRVLDRTGVEKAGRGAPGLGVATVRGTAAELARLRRDPSVESVSAEWKRDFRLMPNDPALATSDDLFPNPGGAPLQWALARENFPAAWSVTTGNGAIVGILDSGIDSGHPELRGKILTADAFGTNTSPGSDEDGHGTHVSGLACAATNDGIGTAGAGYNCQIALVKIPGLTDDDIINGIDRAVAHGAHAINMSFGGGDTNAAVGRAIDRAVARGVVLVAAASNNPDTDQGAPAKQLQDDDAPDINAGRGLVVTAADFFDQNPDTGRGTQVSMAAYGFFHSTAGAPGVVSTYPGNDTAREHEEIQLFPPAVFPACECRRQIGGDNRYAYLQGTSMAAPQVTAAAALMGSLQPSLSASEKIRILKQSARRSGGWTPLLGWGILDAGRALDVTRRIDRTVPSSKARAKKKVTIPRRRRKVKLRVRWSQSDLPGRSGLVASGVEGVDLYLKKNKGRYKRVRKLSRRKTTVLTLRAGTYRIYTRATDNSANRERAPRRADVRVVVKKRKR
jgi:subtilisin family serine protease